jgi:fumarate hydratase subunit beta
MAKKIELSFLLKQMGSLKAGEEVLLSGVVCTARDQAHKRLVEALKAGKRLPFDLKKTAIYYCGPARTRPGTVIGSCGPTTSRRMDPFTPFLLNKGLRVMIGKGSRSPEVRQAIREHKGIYFLALAGLGALIAGCVKKATVVAYKELGPEAIYKLEVRDLPLIVGIDSKGRSIYGAD